MVTPSQVLNDPALFARHFLWILDKDKELVRFRFNRAQRDFMANRTGRDLVLKARQLGFSTVIQGELFRRTVTTTRTTMTMAHDYESTQKLRRMADRFWEHCRFGNAQPARRYSNASLATYPEFDSTSIIATAGSVEIGRGDTYSDCHGSEVAFWPDAERIMAGAMQGGSPDTVLESTPNGAQGWFYDKCMEALLGQGGWKLHFYPWWWDDDYRIALEPGETLAYTPEEKGMAERHGLSSEQIKWRRGKQAELKGFFIQEYPEDPYNCFLTSGDSYFGNVADCFVAPVPTQHQKGHEYRAGLDFGQANDYTALVVVDKTARRHVELLHVRHLPWGEIRRRIAECYGRWHLSFLLAEDNSIGGVNIEELQKLGLVVRPFETTNASKADIMATLHEGLHEKGLQLQPCPVLEHELANFVASQTAGGLWRLAAAGTNHDDTVMALALAWAACEQPDAISIPVPISIEQVNPWRFESGG